MFAARLATLIGRLSSLALIAASGTAFPQEAARGFDLRLTQEPEPESKAWEDPASISLTIDRNGPDTFSAQMNLEVARLIRSNSGRDRRFGANLVWNRESGGDDRQNNLELGGFYSLGYNSRPRLDQQGENFPEDQDGFVDFLPRLSASYARTALYADTSTPACTAMPSGPDCRTQYKESMRASGAAALFSPHLERDPPGLPPFSLAPKVGLDYDHLLNSPVDGDTGTRLRGGYLSGTGGLALSIFDSFDEPRWELSGSLQLRQRLYASESRRAGIERSAILFEGSLTHYIVSDADWSAGVGVTYTRGDDPLTGVSNVDRFVISFRIGT